jgi:DNA primase
VSDFAQTVKQQADIVKIIEGYIRLRKSGAQNYSGLCPFHNEKSPSFSVHQVRQFYHCFGCQASGDVFSFVGKIENVGFPEAVRIVAQKCGIPLPKREYSSPEEAAGARMRGKLLDLHEAACAWFEEQLAGPEGATAREYLTGRGLTPEGIKKFRIGYAPDSFHALEQRLSSMADAETLRASGLFSSKEQGDGSLGPMYDSFRKRVMFPIANESGRVIAFTGRVLEVGEKSGPKYYNSPATPLYTKGQVLFNLDKAKAAIRQAEFALLVEGQMDCISVFLRGIQNVIATSGTAFTEQQVAILKRATAKPGGRPQVVANFDPDVAGKDAAAKTIALLTEEGFNIKIVILDDGLDPDRFIRERGVDAYVKALRGAQTQDSFFIERARQMFPGGSADAKLKAMNYLLPHIRRLPEELMRVQFAADASQKLGIDSAVLREKLRQAALKRRDRVDVDGAGVSDPEKVLIRALANTQPDGSRQREAISAALRDHPEWFQAFTSAPALQEMSLSEDPVAAVTDSVQRSFVASVLFEADRIPIVTQGAARGFESGRDPSMAEVSEILEKFEERSIEAELRDLRMLIAEAERQGDHAELAILTQKVLALDRELRRLHNHRSSEHS